uniref:Uncharacterized protein n=1 Tax=Populus trichocarpa TaxID=3694 RepID=U5G8C0_POPTR
MSYSTALKGTYPPRGIPLQYITWTHYQCLNCRGVWRFNSPEKKLSCENTNPEMGSCMEIGLLSLINISIIYHKTHQALLH